MTLFQLSGVVLTAVAVFGYINHRFIKMPDNIGTTLVGMAASLLLFLFGQYSVALTETAREMVHAIDFSEVVFHGMLPLLLFAGSLHVKLTDLRAQMRPIVLLATAGVAVSTAIVGVTLHYVTAFVGVDIPLVYCLLFGALISPTDPIAVMGVLKQAKASRETETEIAGESLGNDGFGVVVYLLILAVATGAHEPSAGYIGKLLMLEVGGGIAAGLALGYLVVRVLKGMDSYPVEILTTLAAVVGGYAAIESLHMSAPLAMVALGLYVGNFGAEFAMSEETREHLYSFWELLDEILNLVLFGLIGIKLLSLNITGYHVLVGALAIPVVLLGRAGSVYSVLRLSQPLTRALAPGRVAILTWGGLRGAISIALALSLPEFEGRSLLIAATYMAVLFSLLVQAPTLGSLVRRYQ